jgi:hypothetical protein
MSGPNETSKPDPEVRSNSSAILLSPDDNVIVATRNLSIGEYLLVDGSSIMVRDAVARGHKVARAAILKGDKIIKYGALISSATQRITIGEHVHIHNLKSDYTATHLIEASKRVK